ncbi:hypothetical protein CCS38_16115 [Streptomyces purpurogeneiscleroticus]|nr:hypothetical protein [Streptomyces purpurogeneiscleroticus]
MSATSTLAMTHLVPLAKELDENKVTPGVLGFIVFAVIGGAVWLLMKSMNKHMRKVDFEQQPDAATAKGGAAAGADGGAAAGADGGDAAGTDGGDGAEAPEKSTAASAASAKSTAAPAAPAEGAPKTS